MKHDEMERPNFNPHAKRNQHNPWKAQIERDRRWAFWIALGLLAAITIAMAVLL